ncbi:carbohydrate ABC transporter permease [Cohnella suwonensis]|uniref:Carbohydrate ABC transporter permease n=1 Tax=Cohnella suwonensis TaxID=696072 RepID=A0ABW0LNK2_9BACL
MRRHSLFNSINVSLNTIFALFCFLPILLVFIVSLTDEQTILKNGYSYFPDKWSFDAYKLVFTGQKLIWNSYMISIIVTLIGTVLALLVTAMAAYALANKQMKYRNTWAMYFFITMIFSAGLVPWYMICGKLGMKDNILSLIIPGLIFNPFNMFLVRNFMAAIPDSLMESAKIDGANDATIAFRIYFPICKPVLATIALFYGLAYWNNWFNAIMLVDNQNLFPLQYILFKLQSEIAMLSQLQSSVHSDPPGESLKMATAIITIGPIVFLYPYLQRYFIKGLVIGSVKG